MTARDDVVTIHLSVAPPDAETVPQTALPVDVKAAMRGLATRVSPSTGLWMKHRTAVARAIAFNADRYKHAVALAEYHHPGKTIVIRVGNEDRLAPLACALALAMHRAEVGRAVAVVQLAYAERAAPGSLLEGARRTARQAKLACDRALARGHSWVFFGEVCFVLSRYE